MELMQDISDQLLCEGDDLLSTMVGKFVRLGMTIVELMVTVLITSILSVTIGTFFVKLLNIHEQEREEAYVREKIVSICGAYAEYLSIASSASNATSENGQGFSATYRSETGGVSMETGRVTRVTKLHAYRDDDTEKKGTLNLKMGNEDSWRFVRDMSGDAFLMNLTNDIVSVDYRDRKWQLIPLTDEGSLFYLKISARCTCVTDAKEDKGRYVTAGRIVRLWNHESESE